MTPEEEEQQEERFESWFYERYGDKSLPPAAHFQVSRGKYISAAVESAWCGWLAAKNDRIKEGNPPAISSDTNAMLMEVYRQAGNGAPAERRHALTPEIRDRIRDYLKGEGLFPLQDAKDRPLSATVIDDELVIRIGIHTLAFAAKHCSRLVEHPGEVEPPYCIVDDPVELARDVCREMSREEEDGTSPLTNLFDEAILEAWSNGSIGFSEDDPTGEGGDQ